MWGGLASTPVMVRWGNSKAGVESSESCHSMLQLMLPLAGTSAEAVTGTPEHACRCDRVASSEHGVSRACIPREGSIAHPDSLGSHKVSLQL